MNNFKKWVTQNRVELFLLFLVVAVGAFLRFYQFPGHATFLGDEGRDALIVRKMIVDHKFTLLGPTISFGNLYLGPIYYYFMFVPLWLSGLDPAGPAAMVILLGSATVFLVWLVAREFFGKIAAIFSSALYAVSPLVISHTRSSWNPNPMPFFALLTIYSVFKAVKDRNGLWFILTGFCLGITLQLHYIAMVFIASLPLMLLWLRPKINIKWYLAGFAGFIAALSPQILFELRHGFINTLAMINLFTKKGEFTAAAGVGFDQLQPFTLYYRLISSLLSVHDELLSVVVVIFLTAVLIWYLYRHRGIKQKEIGLSILFIWMLWGILAVPLYRGPLHDHYLGFLFPTPFLFFGFAVSQVWNKKMGRAVVVAIFGLLLFLNLSKTNVFSGVGANNQIERVRAVSKSIADDVGDKKFNIALVSPTKDFLGNNYRYFLEYYGKVPEPYDNFKDIDVLYVIEETKWMSPEELNLWEVGTFGSSKVIRDWSFDFQVVVYRLEHK